MAFDIEKIARGYVERRFQKASTSEREKIVKDWVNKVEDSHSLLLDFKKRVGDPAGKKVLDAGSGPGGVSIAFALGGANVYGIDIEKDLFEIAKAHAESHKVNVNFFLYKGDVLPFDDNFFDYVISVSVLEHTTDPAKYLSELLRVTKAGGKCYLAFPNKLWPQETHTGIWFLTYLPSFLRPILIRILKKNPLEENNLHFYGYFDLKRMLEKVKSGSFAWKIVAEEGEARSGWKFIIKKILVKFGISYKTFLSHVLVILEKK